MFNLFIIISLDVFLDSYHVYVEYFHVAFFYNSEVDTCTYFHVAFFLKHNS